MSDFQAIADRVEIEAPGEFTDAATMRGGDRFASLFTHDGVLRMPNIPAPAAAPSCCSAKPPDSEPPGELT